jgi:hypothetical protein
MQKRPFLGLTLIDGYHEPKEKGLVTQRAPLNVFFFRTSAKLQFFLMKRPAHFDEFGIQLRVQ